MSDLYNDSIAYDLYTYAQVNETLLHVKTSNRLYHCQAWTYDDVENGISWLRSYNTIVAVYVHAEHTIYRFGRYSSTTYQHMRKFRNHIAYDAGYTFPASMHAWDIVEYQCEFVNWYK